MNQPDRQNDRRGVRGESIRQIAILLHALPERTHRVLLGQLGTDDKQSIAEQLSSIAEIDAMEQFHVLKRMRDDLQAETSRVEKVESEIQDEIQIGRARVSKKRSTSIYRGTDAVTENPGDFYVKTLSGKRVENEFASPENETTTTSHPLDSFQTQTDVVAGQAAVPPTREVMESMFAQFHQTQAAGVLQDSFFQSGSRQRSERADDALENSASIFPIGEARGAEFEHGNSDEIENADCNAAELAERVDLFLTQLPTQELCRALGMVTTKQAFLVLCGLPNKTAETVLDMLPRRQSRKVRSDMRRMGQLQLSEIDAAKQEVTQIAIRLTTQPKSFAA